MGDENKQKVVEASGEPSDLKPTRSWRLYLITLLLILSTLIGSCCAWLLYVWQTGKAEVARAIAETDALYPHWRWEDLLAQREPLDPAEDAWPIIAQMGLRLARHPLCREMYNHPNGFMHWCRDELMRNPNRKLPLHLTEFVERWHSNDPSVHLLALQLGRYRRAQAPPVALAPDAFATIFGENLIYARQVIEALRVLQERCLEQGRYEEAEAILLAHWIVVSSFDDDLFPGTHLTATELESFSVVSLERYLALANLSASTRRRLVQELDKRASVNRFLLIVRGERGMLQATYENLASGKLRWRQYVQPAWLPPISKGRMEWWEKVGELFLEKLPAEVKSFVGYYYFPQIHARTLQLCIEAERFARLPYGEQVSRHSELFGRAFEQYQEELRTRKWLDDLYWRVFGTHISRGLWSSLTSRQLIEAARAALAAEEYRLRYQRLPTAWQELVPEFLPEVPLDPRDGKPLRLKTTADGIVIYSLGYNNVDDGGDVATGKDRGFRLYHPQFRNLPANPAKPDNGLGH